MAADLVVFHEIDPSAGTELALAWPQEGFLPAQLGTYADVMTEGPLLLAFSRDPGSGSLRISDLMSQREWRANPLYRECHRGLGVDDQMACLLDVGSHVRAISVSRAGRPFSDVERDRMDQVSRHVRLAVHRAERDPSPCLGLQVAPDVRWAEVPVSRPSRPVLTARQAEVMALLATGRTRAHIARSLGCSPRTVDKHVENIHLALGVTNRIDAITRWRARP
ncbi:MAG TPA: LuxR C-terminal-related transcriptional regulator [Actinomycetales bacterium]